MKNSKLQFKIQNYKFLFVSLLFFVLCSLFFSFDQTVSAEQSAVGVLRGIACIPSNWFCKTEDTTLPDILCCWWHCLPKEILPPHECPTNQDLGQKDGTGKTGADRHYYYFDYDLEKVVEVPPVLPD